MGIVKKSKDAKRKLVSETIAAITTTSTHEDAYNLLGIKEAAFYKRLRQYPEIREVIATMKDRALEILQQGAPKAANKIVSDIDGRNGFEAAKEVLDRVGVGRKDAPQVAVQVNNQMQVEYVESDTTSSTTESSKG